MFSASEDLPIDGRPAASDHQHRILCIPPIGDQLFQPVEHCPDVSADPLRCIGAAIGRACLSMEVNHAAAQVFVTKGHEARVLRLPAVSSARL